MKGGGIGDRQCVEQAVKELFLFRVAILTTAKLYCSQLSDSHANSTDCY
jgi:hypothetical protein